MLSIIIVYIKRDHNIIITIIISVFFPQAAGLVWNQ